MAQCVWNPEGKRRRYRHMENFIESLQNRYQLSDTTTAVCHDFSIRNPGSFWKEVSDFTSIVWSTPPRPKDWDMFPMSFEQPRWNPQGVTLNFAENLLPAPGDQIVVSAKSEAGITHVTSNQLRAEVARVQKGLLQFGVQKGDRVAGVVVNGIEAIVAMLATTALGGVWSSCSPDFGAQAIADRLGSLEAKVWFVTPQTLYAGKKYDQTSVIEKALNLVESPPAVVVSSSVHPDWLSYQDFGEEGELVLTPCAPNDPVYILFSSGTTGKPKGIVHGILGTLLQHRKELMLHTGLGQDSVLMYFTTCGWMMWNWMVSALGVGSRLVLWDGKPDPQDVWETCRKMQVQAMGMSPAWVRQNILEDVTPNLWSQLEVFLSTGSPLLPEHFSWLKQHLLDVQVASISGGTDIVSCFLLGDPTKPVYEGELQAAGLGMAVEVYVDGKKAKSGEVGELVCTQPFPSMPVCFWRDPDGQKYKAAYFDQLPGVWCHGDAVYKTEHEGYVITGRSDATLNPGGVRIGTAELYQQVEVNHDITDSLAISWDTGEQVVVLLFVQTRRQQSEIEKSLKAHIRKSLSPRHVPWAVFVVKDIPYTRSGKKMEILIRDIFAGKKNLHLGAVRNPECLEEYKRFAVGLRSQTRAS